MIRRDLYRALRRARRAAVRGLVPRDILVRVFAPEPLDALLLTTAGGPDHRQRHPAVMAHLRTLDPRRLP